MFVNKLSDRLLYETEDPCSFLISITSCCMQVVHLQEHNVYWTSKLADQIWGFMIGQFETIQITKTCDSDWLIWKFNIALADNQLL